MTRLFGRPGRSGMAEYPDKADRRRALTVDTEPPPPPPPPKEALRLRQQMWEVGEVQRQEIRARALSGLSASSSTTTGMQPDEPRP